MIWVILSLLCAGSDSAAFGTAYLPPPNAKDAGGHEDDLEVPLEPPYIDPYSDNRHLVPEEERYYFGYGLRDDSPRGIGDADQILDSDDNFLKYRGRFLYGSYSYIGKFQKVADPVAVSIPPKQIYFNRVYNPKLIQIIRQASDNVIVTVTYTSDRKKPKNKNTHFDDCDECGSRYDDFGLFGNGLVPTPPGLPSELQRAFAFHRKAYPKDNRSENLRRKQSKNEESAGKSTIQRGYSLRNDEPFNYSVNNVQVS